ncbi:MAG TPA: polymer-forming cytoskeletal protein [Usitatibacter sp.]
MKYADNLFARRDPRPPVLSAPSQPPSQTHSHAPGAAPADSVALARSTSLPPQPAAPESSAKSAEDLGGSKLIVGPNIKLKGVEIDDCDTLVVEGRVEATMVSRAIQIAENGAFNGKVDVDVAEIRGEFAGEMTARKKLVIHASGRVSGKIRYGKMLVQEGGELSGDIAALDSQAVQLVR